MAASRVDSEIGQDHTTIRRSSASPVIADESRSKYLNDKNDEVERVIVVEDRYESMGHDRPGKNESLIGQNKANERQKTIGSADQGKSSEEIKDRKSSRDEEYKARSVGKRVSVEDPAIQIKKQKRKTGNNEASISSRVIYKLVGPGKHRGDTAVKGDQREASPRNHVNLIADRVDGSPEGSGTSRTEVARKLSDSQPAVKRRDERTTSKESPREPRSSNDATPVRKARKQRKCENCGEPHLPYSEGHPYQHKYPGYSDGEAVEYAEGKDGAKGVEFKQETPVASLLFRSKSLPRLSMHDSGVACSGNEQIHVAVAPHSSKQWVADLKQLHTLKQHYYPEGGWGWIVVFAGVLVQVLSHGIHGSNGVFLQQVANKFGPHAYLESG